MPTWLKVFIPLAAAGGLVVTGVVVAVIVFVVTAWLGLPLPVFGFNQPPPQPIQFDHTIHAGTGVVLGPDGKPVLDSNGNPMHGLGLDCTFCHRDIMNIGDVGQAVVPPIQLCTFCHQVVGPKSDPRILPVLRGNGLQPFTGAIDWHRVYRLPDNVRFYHAPHIQYLMSHPNAIQNNPNIPQLVAASSNGTVPASAVCSTCHGDVAAMHQVKEVEPLKMGQCVNCHRDNNAPTTCSTCHY